MLAGVITMLQYTLLSLSVVSTGPTAASVQALVNVKDTVDNGINSDRLIDVALNAAALNHVNAVLDAIATAMTAKIPGAPVVTRQTVVVIP